MWQHHSVVASIATCSTWRRVAWTSKKPRPSQEVEKGDWGSSTEGEFSINTIRRLWRDSKKKKMTKKKKKTTEILPGQVNSMEHLWKNFKRRQCRENPFGKEQLKRITCREKQNVSPQISWRLASFMPTRIEPVIKNIEKENRIKQLSLIMEVEKQIKLYYFKWTGYLTYWACVQHRCVCFIMHYFLFLTARCYVSSDITLACHSTIRQLCSSESLTKGTRCTHSTFLCHRFSWVSSL